MDPAWMRNNFVQIYKRMYIQGVRKILPDWKVEKFFWSQDIL